MGEVLINTTTTPGGALSRANTNVKELATNKIAPDMSRVPFRLNTRDTRLDGIIKAIGINKIAGTKFRMVAASTGGVSCSPTTVERNPTAHKIEVSPASPIPI